MSRLRPNSGVHDFGRRHQRDSPVGHLKGRDSRRGTLRDTIGVENPTAHIWGLLDRTKKVGIKADGTGEGTVQGKTRQSGKEGREKN